MNWIKGEIHRFREKTVPKKFFDIIFIGFIVFLLFPDGRIALQRLIVNTGIMNTQIEAENRVTISENVFQNFVFSDDQGLQHSLSEFKGQVIFLNFWATWCPPCRAELPSITNLYHKMENKEGIKFLFLSYEKHEVVNVFAADFGTDIPFSFLTFKVPGELNPPGLPTTFVIDKSGRIVSQTNGMANWDSEDFILQLESLIKE
tara:strand:+ start:539 stop:1147 length:609 start_codon:yes stop_codon:yes gene_type:complete